MAFPFLDSPRFPTGISYGTLGGPGTKSYVFSSEGGVTSVLSRWSRPLRRYDVAYGVKSMADLMEVIEFFIAVGGPANAFRYKDPLDFTTASDHQSTHTKDDQSTSPASGDGSNQRFAMQKVYSKGVLSSVRPIDKPVESTILVALDGVLESDSNYTIDGGDIVFTTAPGVGVNVTYGCEFDVPVRFSEELPDEVLAASLDSFDNGSLPAMPLVEVRDPGRTTSRMFMGGSDIVVMSADLTVNPANRAYVVNPSTTGLSVYLPNPTNLPDGGPYWVVNNISTDSVALKDHLDTTIVTLAQDDAVQVWLATDNASAKTWLVF